MAEAQIIDNGRAASSPPPSLEGVYRKVKGGLADYENYECRTHRDEETDEWSVLVVFNPPARERTCYCVFQVKPNKTKPGEWCLDLLNCKVESEIHREVALKIGSLFCSG